MNWSIEQNYILLKFVRVYGENEWTKHANELRDMFTVYLTNVSDIEINNFNEEDFRRQYNYILATTRQECLKQGNKIIKSSDLAEIALKKFCSYLEMQQVKDERAQNDERILRLLEEGDLNAVGHDTIMEMREKIYCIVGEDLMGMAFSLGPFSGTVQRDACVSEMAQSWVRRLSDGRICVAGDCDVFPEKLLTELYDASKISDHVNDSDSDLTDTLEEQSDTPQKTVISFEEALEDSELNYRTPSSGVEKGLERIFGHKKIIAGWDLTGKEERTELDDRLHRWQESLTQSCLNFAGYMSLPLSVITPITTIITKEQRQVSTHCSPPSSASTQEASNGRPVFATTDSYDITTGSPSADTALSHATDREEELEDASRVNDSLSIKRKRKARQTVAGVSSKKIPEKGGNKETENKKKIMRNITKMIVEHPYSSIFIRNIREDTGIYKQATLSITKINHDVIDGNFRSYEHFVEMIILFFLQMKIYYFGDKETVKKIESVYVDVSKQLSFIYPDLNETVPLSDLFQRRQKRFKGHYA